jgi:hypothetical protein
MITVNSYTKIEKFSLTEIRKAGIFLANGMTPLEWYNKQTDKPKYVFNCGLFSGGSPVFTLKIDGKELIKDSLYRGLAIKDNKFAIGNVDDIPSDDFVSGAPVLTYKGINQVSQAWIDTLSTIAGKEPRVVFGFDQQSGYILFVEGRLPNKQGATLEELPLICLNNGIPNAVNLDGGYSAMVVIDGKIVNEGKSYRGVNNLMAIWVEGNMEWKEPNWNWIWTKYAQVDKDGKIKVQNNDYGIAKMNAEKDGYAVWEKATKKRVYPEEVLQNVTETEKSVISEPINAEKVFLESIKKMIDERLNNLNG